METKPWYLSRILWSAIITIVAQVIVLLGIFTPEVDTSAVVQKINDPGTVNIVLDIVTVVAAMYTAFLRVKGQPTTLTK